MTDLDKMMRLGEIATRDGIVVSLRRDYEDLMLGDFRLTPEAVGALEDKIAEWKTQVNDYLLRADAAAVADDDLDDDWDGGTVTEGDPFPGRPGYVTGRCGHAVAGSEWRAGYRNCERCGA